MPHTRRMTHCSQSDDNTVIYSDGFLTAMSSVQQVDGVSSAVHSTMTSHTSTQNEQSSGGAFFSYIRTTPHEAPTAVL